MEATFEKTTFAKRLKSMFKVDFKRMFTMPLVYIMAGISLVLPILILVMTTMMGNGTTVDPVTGAEKAMETFTNVWQSIGSVSGAAMGMDLTSMCNINMLYFLVAVFVCIFVADDFRSGYAKNLFTVRAKKVDYVFSKTLALFVGACIMFVLYFIGAVIGGAIAGLSFSTAGFGVGGVIACMLSKIFMTAIFVSIALLLGTVAKQRLWLSVLGSFAAGMLLFTMISITAPLNAGVINVMMCLAGGGLFAVGLGAASNVILNKTNLV
ncbi:MAG: hypothetical protein K2M95_03985 [Clostridiales bacterium]|nr:hypothetical protein [Clostridiales bacterium]